MPPILRLSISLDGRQLGASGRPLLRGLSHARIAKARELEVTIHPIIVGSSPNEQRREFPEGFLPEESRWELISTRKGEGGAMLARYRQQ